MPPRKRKPVQRSSSTRTPAPKTTPTGRKPAPTRKALQSPAHNTNPESLTAITTSLRALFHGYTVNLLELPFRDPDAARLAITLGAVHVPRINKYVVKGDIVPSQLQRYRTEDYSYWRWVEDDINMRVRPARKPDGPIFQPRPHQQECVDDIAKAAAAGWRGYVLADSTGLGKTLSALQGLSDAATQKGFTATNPGKTLILCPKNAIPHWRNTIRHSGIRNLRFLVVNYDQYKNLLIPPTSAVNAKKATTKNRHISEKGTPFINWDYIISDESQKIKNFTSQRTKGFQRIAEYNKPANKAPFIIWVSATIGQTPLELGYLAPLIGQAARTNLDMENWGQWLKENKFHVELKGETWQWVKPDSPENIAKQREDVKRLASIIFHPKAPSIRRKPEDIAGWPEIVRIGWPVQLTDAANQHYQKLWTDFRKTLLLKPHGKNPKSVLAEQLRFAQKASLLRTPQTVDMIVEMLENGYQTAVSFRFLESLEDVKTRLKQLGIAASEFSGRTFINNEHERLLFQKGINKVILFTAEEAVSFHANEQLPDGSKASPFPRTLLIHDLRYSALQITQIIGRTHRDGEASNAYFLYSEDTVEEKILNIMLNKLENMTVLSGDEEEDVIMEILDQILESKQ